MFGVLVFKLNKGLEKKVKIQYKYMLVFLVLIFMWIGLCWLVGYQLAVIPPFSLLCLSHFRSQCTTEKWLLNKVLC